MNTTPLTILLGGTFDPIHNGHLRICTALHQHLANACIELMPNYQCADHKSHQATTKQRLNMIQLAIQDKPFISVNTIELDRKGTSYTYDTFLELRQLEPQAPLAFACGSDTLINMPQWDHYTKLLELTHLIVVDRPQFELSKSDWAFQILKERGTQNPNDLQQNNAKKILLLDIPPMKISSTEIRARHQRQQSIAGLTPSAVNDYIHQEQLYRQS